MGRATQEPILYQICVKEQLEEQWSGWLDGAALSYEDNGTALTCRMADQAALQGVLRQLYALGLTLVSVNPVEKQTSQGKTRTIGGAEDVIQTDALRRQRTYQTFVIL
jgi:hypothetical protein